MNTKKGMSQVLSIIVAASVLMMVGLTLVIMAQGSIGDMFSDSNRQSCINTIKSTCRVNDYVPLPQACDRAEASPSDLVTQAGANSVTPDGNVTC